MKETYLTLLRLVFAILFIVGIIFCFFSLWKGILLIIIAVIGWNLCGIGLESGWKNTYDKFASIENDHVSIDQSLNTKNPNRSYSYGSSLGETVKFCNELKTDLVEMSEHRCACGECAKYQGRVYSLYGKDKRFPLLPQNIQNNGVIHEGCTHSLSPFIYGVSVPTYHENILEYSNSPFVDNRSKLEIAEYEAIRTREENLLNDRNNYDLLLNKIPEITPKSFSGYRRMKNGSTKNFIVLKNAAKEVGIDL